MKRLIFIFLLCLTLPLPGQQYQVPDISVSRDKVRVDGKSYYAHVVTAKQTLYSISKVYGVSLQDIYDANRNLDLERSGLKTGQVLLIPVQTARPAEIPDQVGNDAKGGTDAGKAEQVNEPAVKDEAGRDEGQDKSLFPQLKALLREMSGQEDSTEVAADIPDVIKVSVLLPFDASAAADTKSLDFYSGILLAARDLGTKGVKLEINAYDIAGGRISGYMLDADVILGPVSQKDVATAAHMLPRGKYLISPLEPKNAGMADSLRIVQAPTPAARQAEDAVRWAVADMTPGDSLVLIREKGKNPSDNSIALIRALKASGRRYSTISYDLLDGLQIQPLFVEHSSPSGVTRYLIASEEESFVNDAVRNINLMVYKKQDVALYGPSKLRGYGTIETENLHNVSSHISASYQIDYTKADVQAFVFAYRALFGAEPGQFAFHGYDCLTYFATMCSRYGRGWFRSLPSEGGHGLQTDFSFGAPAFSGQVNGAVRRAVYTPDFEIVLQ